MKSLVVRSLSTRTVPQAEFIAQDMVTPNRVDGVLAQPTLAAHFSGDGGLAICDGVGELIAQIKITTDAFLVEAVEAEYRPCVLEVDRVLELSALGKAVGVVIREI